MKLHDESIYEGIDKLGLKSDLQGWHANHPIFAELIDELEPPVIIEAGTWKGASAIRMANHARNRCALWANPPQAVNEPHLYCVDTWLGSREIWANPQVTRTVRRLHGLPLVYFQFLHNVVAHGLQANITPLPMTTRDGAAVLAQAGVKVKLIYQDASHDYADLCWDLPLYWELLERGGVMFGDDYSGFPGVALAVDEFAQKRNLERELVARNFWILRKP